MTRRRWILIVGLAILLLIAAFFGLIASGRQLISTVLNRGNEKPVSYLCPVADLSGPVALADCTDCTYYPVDKTNGLPSNYQPNLIETGLPGGGRVAAIVRQSLHDLFADAQAQGFSPVVSSGYRSYDEQAATFRYWVFQEWQRTSNLFQAVTNAEHYSAWEGHSEHQLGTAVDINCIACEAFDDQDARNIALWKYLEDNAYRFGFAISYPRNMEDRTGYQYEPWHVRYIGVDAATALYEQGYAKGNGMCALTLLRLQANDSR